MAQGWRDVVPVILLVIGLGIAGYGQFLMPEPGVYLHVAEEPTSPDDLASEAPVIAYEELSPRMQRKFDRRLSGQRTYIGPALPESFPWAVHEIGYVRYQGDYYATGFVVRHPTMVAPDLVVLLGLLASVIGLSWGGRRLVLRR